MSSRAMRSAGSSRRRRAGLSRSERSELTRKALFEAAARVVGRYGYAGASVSRITMEAKVAQGTFYLYFDSRQDLLDQLLPSLGDAFVASIRERVQHFDNEIDREEERLRAFLDYAVAHPEFFRILHEAEMFAPKAHRQHLLNLERGYVRALKSGWLHGDLPGFEERELEPISYILMAARDYLAMRYSFWDGKAKRVPPHVITAYMKLVRRGLFGTADARQALPPLGLTPPELPAVPTEPDREPEPLRAGRPAPGRRR